MIVMKRNLKYALLFLSLLPVLTVNILSQDVTSISPYVQLQYFKNTDNRRILQTTLTYSKNRMELPLAGMDVSFYTDAEKKELLATVLTDKNGIAKIELGEKKLKTDRDGLWSFSSEFAGNDTIEAGSSEITIKDVNLVMGLSEVDSIKIVTVKASVNENGKEKPVSGETVMVYVPRMFSLLPIGELTLDDSGIASIEFPSDLPGGKDGNLIVIAKFEDNAAFGNVEKNETLKWGMPTNYSVPVSHRALWTKTAPRWMIYTLTVLLAGVWGHYLFAIISLVRIRINAKKIEL